MEVDSDYHAILLTHGIRLITLEILNDPNSEFGKRCRSTGIGPGPGDPCTCTTD